MLLGRHREIAQVDALLDDTKEGGSATLLLHGDAGIGKSALLGNACDRAAALGFTVPRTRGFESESDIPFAARSSC